MKWLSVLVVCTLLGACTETRQDESAQSLDSAAQDERENMMTQIADMTALLQDIDDSLSKVAGDIVDITGEPGAETQLAYDESVRAKVGRVVAQLDNYKAKIEQQEVENYRLQQQYKHLKSSDARIIDNLKNLLASREAQIEDLQRKANEAIERLEAEKEARLMAEHQRDTAIFHRVRAERMTASTRDSLRRERQAWFIAETEDDLENAGFEWMGEATFLNFGGHLAPPPDVDRLTFYQPIRDVSQWNEFVAPAEIERIHSAHAEAQDAYIIEGKTLRITDWRRFWSAGKYLTIALND